MAVNTSVEIMSVAKIKDSSVEYPVSSGDACLHVLECPSALRNPYPALKSSAGRPSVSSRSFLVSWRFFIGAIAALLYNASESKIGGGEIELVNTK
jgi:hypothetical protein